MNTISRTTHSRNLGLGNTATALRLLSRITVTTDILTLTVIPTPTTVIRTTGGPDSRSTSDRVIGGVDVTTTDITVAVSTVADTLAVADLKAAASWGAALWAVES